MRTVVILALGGLLALALVFLPLFAGAAALTL